MLENHFFEYIIYRFTICIVDTWSLSSHYSIRRDACQSSCQGDYLAPSQDQRAMVPELSKCPHRRWWQTRLLSPIGSRKHPLKRGGHVSNTIISLILGNLYFQLYLYICKLLTSGHTQGLQGPPWVFPQFSARRRWSMHHEELTFLKLHGPALTVEAQQTERFSDGRQIMFRY